MDNLKYSGGINRLNSSTNNYRYSGQYSESEYTNDQSIDETPSESGDIEPTHHNIPVLEYPSFLTQPTDQLISKDDKSTTTNSNITTATTTTTTTSTENDEDLENVISNYLFYEKDVDILTERLGKTLSTLETEMIVGILDSGLGVNDIISQLGDKDGTHLTGVTAWIEYYNKQLQDMKKYIEHIESKNNKMEIVSRNQRSLYSELNTLINLMTLDEKTIKTLNSPQFNDTVGLEQAIKAANELKKALTTKLKSGMENMVAVKDQRKVFETYKVTFARKVATLIENIFKAPDKETTKPTSVEEFPDHSEYYRVLNHFKPLVHWLKEMDNEKFIPIVALYIKAYRSTYKHEIKDFFSSLQHSIIKETKDQNDFFSSSSSSKKSIDHNLNPPTPATPSKKDQGKKRTIDKLFRYALSCLESYLMAKQNFVKEFFLYEDPPRIAGHHHHHHHNRSSDRKDKKDRKEKKDKKEKKEKKRDKKDNSIDNNNIDSTNNNNDQISPSNNNSSISPSQPNSPPQESPDAPLDLILTEMFDGVVGELCALVEKADQINPFYHLTMLVDTEQYISAHSNKDSEHSSFLIKILSEVQKSMKTLFNKFLDIQVESIKSTQVSLKRCGVLSHFRNFPVFVKEIEKYRSKNEEESITSLINSSYFKIIVNLFSWLDGLVDKLPDDEKTGKYKFISKLENYYYFTLKMEELNIKCLEQYRETSSIRYQENLKIYIDYLIALKFKPLWEFYFKMDELLLTLPPSDIQFQQSHSKQQFKKIVEKFKTENIDKGLLKALLNIQKNISKETNLIVFVWEQLEDAFIEKYDHFQEITQQCYNQTMPVNSDQIIGIFATVYKKNPNKHH